MTQLPTRREFLLSGTAAVSAVALAPLLPWHRSLAASVPQLFPISLAQWSLHRELAAKTIDHLDFARVTREVWDLDAIEYVNSFFKDKARDAGYLATMNQRAADHAITQHLIMCDGEGRLGDPDPALRTQAVANHFKWVDAAAVLGCAHIRVNAASDGTFEEQQRLAADGLRRLCEYGDQHGINVIVENHGGLSSNGQWLAGVMRLVDHPRCGTLPDFGNFYDYDRYQGVAELMPFAKAVSAKAHDFDDQGNETAKDYLRLMRTVLDAGYRGWVGIEYEGDQLPEREGITRTLRLLQRVRDQLAPHYPIG